MEINRVVPYFDKPEDDLLFTVAASSIMAEATLPGRDAGIKMALEI
jgi:hypothetical protein